MAARHPSAFTLIELLVVVAIIAILIAIAVVNFMNAKTRALVSRAEAELRSFAMAIANYQLDNGEFPADVRIRNLRGEPDPPWDPAKLLYVLSTPVAYMSSVPSKDPFPAKGFDRRDVQGSGRWRHFYYIYFNEGGPPENLGQTRGTGWATIYPHRGPQGLGPGFRYKWKMYSNGPDNMDIELKNGQFYRYSGGEPVYDPTNGLRSWGDITRWGPE